MEPIGFTETSVIIYISTQRNISEEGRSDFNRDRYLNSYIMLGITTDTWDSAEQWTTVITDRVKVPRKRFGFKNFQVYMCLR